MKSKFLITISILTASFLPIVNYAQAPNLGTTSGYTLFTTSGAVTNTGTTLITGDVGTNSGAVTGSATIVGQTQVANAASAQAATDVGVAYSDLGALTCGSIISTTLGNNQVLTPNIYCLSSGSSLSGILTLDGQCNANSVFVFKINGALTTSTFSNIILINSASISNVYWQINGAFALGAGSVFRGTVVANGAISLGADASLKGRALTIAGTINTNTNVATYFEGALWNGSSSSDFATAANWSFGSVPSLGEQIRFTINPSNHCNLDANRIVGNIINASNKNFVLNGYQLTVQATITQSSTGKIDPSVSGSTIIMAGCAAQIIPANTCISNLVPNLTINNTSGVSIGGTLGITKTLTIASGILTTGSNLTLISNVSGTAMIAEISTGGISGNIKAQRYIPANGRKYRFLASPVVNGTSLQWRNNAGNTSGIGTQITGSTGTVDNSTSNQSSAFLYDEDDATAGNDINHPTKWDAIDGNTTLNNGQGYRIFVRGDRSISLTTVNTTNNETTLGLDGTYPPASVTLPVTFTSAAAQGWNLVGNPYPCTIDWDVINSQVSTSDFNNTDNAIYIWNPLNTTKTTGGYSSYVNGIGSGTSIIGTRYISSGQAFFVKANAASPIIKVKEAHKISSEAGSNIFKAGNLKPNSLRLKLYNGKEQVDDAVLYFEKGATKNFDSKFDAYDLTDGIGFLTGDTTIVLAICGEAFTTDTIKLAAKLTGGVYKLAFGDLNSFNIIPEIYLIDNYLNKNVKIYNNDVYTFEVLDSNVLTYGNNRFELVFAKASSDIDHVLSENTKLSVYPNPAIDMVNIIGINSHSAFYDWTIFNIGGEEMKSGSGNNEMLNLNISDLESGLYLIKVKGDKLYQVAKFVK
ncbi:MAG: DUF3494 domain-containing protein [Bacteroidia bacterium]|nr:DUF3494 domain-containing protein [Bacteroidia bacterium]